MLAEWAEWLVSGCELHPHLEVWTHNRFCSAKWSTFRHSQCMTIQVRGELVHLAAP